MLLGAPVANFLEPFAASLLEESDPVPGVLELMDVSPDFGLPGFVVRGGFPAGSAARVQLRRHSVGFIGVLQFNEDRAHFLDLLVLADNVLIAEQVVEAQFPGFNFCLQPGVEGAVLGPHLFR